MADKKEKYIDIGRASISSLVERADTSIALNSFVNINIVGVRNYDDRKYPMYSIGFEKRNY